MTLSPVPLSLEHSIHHQSINFTAGCWCSFNIAELNWAELLWPELCYTGLAHTHYIVHSVCSVAGWMVVERNNVIWHRKGAGENRGKYSKLNRKKKKRGFFLVWAKCVHVCVSVSVHSGEPRAASRFTKLKMSPPTLYVEISFVSFFICDVCQKARRMWAPASSTDPELDCQLWKFGRG